ncbi:carbohydrate kinase [Herbiconiux moechotypicola]|uniref:Carbohydrate kinase n=2 Tax=Herbiconiux moechotypicola TaxID=637393 RepID=A0ABN3DC50_9MICO
MLAIGEALVDVVVPDVPGAEPIEHPGGSPMNIAFGCARLGVPSTLLTAVGADARGRRIVDRLSAAGVTIADGSVRDEPTSTATAHLRADGSAEYEFDLRWSLPTETPELPELVHVGSIAAFLEPGAGQLVALLTAAAPLADAPVVTFDPNIRPSIVPPHAETLARFEQLAALSTVVKLSDEDADWLYPGQTPDEQLARILRLGPALAVMTRGGEGALLRAATGAACSAAGRPVDVVDTIGAGDSFMSALIARLAALLDGGTPAAALRDGSAFEVEALEALGGFAARCASVTVSRAGANPPTLAEVPPPPS